MDEVLLMGHCEHCGFIESVLHKITYQPHFAKDHEMDKKVCSGCLKKLMKRRYSEE